MKLMFNNNVFSRKGYIAPAKIDPKLLDPRHIFKEVEPEGKKKISILQVEVNVFILSHISLFANYHNFSIKRRAPIKRWPRFNAGSKPLLFK